MPRRSLLNFFLIQALCLLSATAGVNVWNHGNFDDPADSRPPKGWTLWGDPKFKNPANYTIDSKNPHAGTGCFRLDQPASTAGYINTEPSAAIHPKRGMKYEITFWARRSAPGTATLVVEGYASAETLAGWRNVAQQNFQAGQKWSQITLTLYEGWDFLVGRENILMIALRPASSTSNQDVTLWVDDFQVIESPSDRPGRMIDPATVKAEPMNHRLQPGDALRVTIDADKRIRHIEEAVGGVSFHRVSGWMGLPYDRQGSYCLPQEQENAIRELHLPMTRFYGVGDESYSLEESIDKAAEVCRKVGIPLDKVVLEFEIQDASKTLPPEVWARGVKHSRNRGYGFRHWEVSNEPYVFGTSAFPEKDSYLKHFLAVSQAIRAVQPDAKIGMATWGDDSMMQLAAGHYDFLVKHHYVFDPSTQTAPFEALVLGSNYDKLDEIQHLNAIMHACNPNREVFQYDTEWGMHADAERGPGHNNRNANVIGTLHRAVRLLHYAREGMLKGSSSWEMFSPAPQEGYTFGFIPKDTPGQYYMFYWLYYVFNRHVGEWTLQMDGTAPWYKPEEGLFKQQDASGPLTPMLASLDSSGDKLFIVVVNGSWSRDVPCEIELKHFEARSAVGEFLSNDDLDASPLVKHKEDFVKPLSVQVREGVLRCTLPPHAACFITINRAKP